jgi:hypothetical protein
MTLSSGLLEENGTCSRNRTAAILKQLCRQQDYWGYGSEWRLQLLLLSAGPDNCLTRASLTSKTRSTPFTTRLRAPIACRMWPGNHVMRAMAAVH